MATLVNYTSKSFLKLTPGPGKQHFYKKERVRLKIVGTFQCHVLVNNNNKVLRYPVGKFSRQFLNPIYS